MATIETKIWLAIERRIKMVARQLDLKVDWPLIPFEKPQLEGELLPYLEVREIPNAIDRIIIQPNRPYDRPGLTQVTVCWPSGQIGIKPGQERPGVLKEKANLVAGYFPDDLDLKFDDQVMVMVREKPSVAQPMREDAYWRVPVTIRHRTFA